MINRQALGIDINEFARTGGINYDLVIKHFQRGEYDFLIIKAGIGLTKSELLDEQRKNADLHRIPYATYHLPDPRRDLKAQARKYVEWVGANERIYIVDVEKPAKNASPRTRMQLNAYIDELVSLTNKVPILYSRANLLKDIGFLVDAKEFNLWIAQYLFDISKLPHEEVQYRYFHDFTRDYGNMVPPAIHQAGLAENVIMWQFSEKGNGPYYIYNRHTAHPEFTIGMKQADLNISIQPRDVFMQSMFGEVPSFEEAEIIPATGGGVTGEPTYPGVTNQDMINLIYTAARPFTEDPWVDFIVSANLEHLATPPTNREKPYTGMKIEQIPSWDTQEKDAVLRLIHKTPSNGDGKAEPTYPDLTNQDMVNILFNAAGPFTDNPWEDWVMPAGLSSLAVPSGNRRKPYTGPKAEKMPNLTAAEKAAVLELINARLSPIAPATSTSVEPS